MIDDIYSHFEKEYPNEGCGIIVDNSYFIPCKNVNPGPSSFGFCPTEYLNLRVRYNITGIVHNHINESNEPSQSDIKSCNALQIPYYIFKYPEMELNIVQPEKVNAA
jgi:proteasome lid subunit RPN8/RPN11